MLPRTYVGEFECHEIAVGSIAYKLGRTSRAL